MEDFYTHTEADAGAFEYRRGGGGRYSGMLEDAPDMADLIAEEMENRRGRDERMAREYEEWRRRNAQP